MAKKDDEKQPIIIIKKVKKVSGGHHGGAWKVAYADFVTAMMAFFLLLWLLNVTTAQQKDLISSYFAPTDLRVSDSASGSGGVMGGTTMSPDGAMTEDRTTISADREPHGSTDGEDADLKEKMKMDEKLEEQLNTQDEKAFKETEGKLKQAIESVPELKILAQNLLIDMTPEGLRIQIVDQEGKPMFNSGSTKPLPEAEKLLRLITQTINTLPNHISIRGHTDSKPYIGTFPTYGNWELSADRANASRRIILDSGFTPTRVENVQGKAEREPLIPNDPANARNRRISIILLKQSLTAGVTADKKKTEEKLKALTPQAPSKPAPKKREEGVIYFP